MEFGEVLKKRLRGMAVRILANIEHTVGSDLDAIGDDEQFTLTGSELKIIRSEILNAAGDTTRSLSEMAGSSKPGKVSFSREVIQILNQADVKILKSVDEALEMPVFYAYGDFNMLNKIRNEVGAGVVYNRTYTCAGIDDIIDSLLPFLDSAQLAGIKIAEGEYREWRDTVCEMYLEDLENE